MIHLRQYNSPLGTLTLVSDGKALTGLRFGWQDGLGERQQGAGRGGNCGDDVLPVYEDTCRWLDSYFAGRDPGFLPEMAPVGTPFRKEVWDLLLSIPYGKTVSYGELATAVAAARGIGRTSAQAIGGAVGHNPIPIIIPCHRVIAADGSIGGFSAGLEVKRWLLSHEGIII